LEKKLDDLRSATIADRVWYEQQFIIAGSCEGDISRVYGIYIIDGTVYAHLSKDNENNRSDSRVIRNITNYWVYNLSEKQTLYGHPPFVTSRLFG
jgi:hypothetical protein